MSRYFAKKARDPMSSYTHFWGAIASVLATLVMVIWGMVSNSSWVLILGAAVFGFSLTALYSASSVYHFVKAGDRCLQRLRKLDHSMIYVLIAGSYTPVCLAFMQRDYALKFLAVIWGMAVSGIIIKLFWLNAPRVLYTALYLAMGWAIVLDLPSLAAMPAGCFGLILAGGLLYTTGAVLYIIKNPNLPKGWGFHELFHMFILAGSACHVLAVLLFVL